ncbi:MAG: type II toxin-antitoxin system death-on-curing family toxin [Patescibacteria group bacterium]|nr:type II toxin-antitoxin system death-on-curing family toxin [Patescibacteria group bacterium]
MIEPIGINEIKYLAHRLAIDTMDWDEPIPEFETRYPNVLESCIATPFQLFERKSLYKGLSGKGAILFYLLIKNHPFQNGNKRLAVTSLLVFLYKNNKWLTVDGKELYNFAVWIAQSPALAKDQMLLFIEKFIKKNLESFDKLKNKK